MDAIDEIKQRLAIEDVIGEYVELKRSGRNFKGLSPFTAEKTASFMVSPEKQIWHDFSSGKGGNIFSFIMDMEGMDFKGSLEYLARKAGVDLAQYRNQNYSNNTKIKEQLYRLLEMATKFYQLSLKSNQLAVDYVFKNRTIDKKTALDFKIGYSPEQGDALTKFLLDKKFKPDEIKKAGLGNYYNGVMRDMFRGRIMIPLMDSTGRTIGFTARILRDDPNAPKYINTPSTILYDKSRHVFGLNLAKESIRKRDFTVVVEGNMDVISSHQSGVKNVVATAGTAMTKQHFKEISRFTSDIRLCFDKDTAGQAATERTIILAVQEDIKLGVITIPSGKDPDDLIKEDKKIWQDIINKPEYAIDWLLLKYKSEFDLKSGDGKKMFTNKARPLLSQIPNSVEQEHYKKMAADILGVSLEAFERQMVNQSKKILKKPKNIEQRPKSFTESLKTENQYVCLLLMQPSLREYSKTLAKYPSMIKNQIPSQLFEIIVNSKDLKLPEILESNKEMQKIEDYGKISALLYEELYADLEFIELEYEATRLQTRIVEGYVKEQKRAITAKLQTETDEKRVNELLTRAKKLDQLLKATKEIKVAK